MRGGGPHFGRLGGLAVATVLLGAGCGRGNPTPIDGSLPAAPAAAELEAALLASADAWNRGDLDGFMEPYLRSPDLTFSGSSGVRRGFESVLARYRASYFDADAPLPTLRFADLETRDLGPDHALMLGRYILLAPGAAGAPRDTVIDADQRAGPDSVGRLDDGYFSLVWVRTLEGWRIMHDHTSAAAP